MRLASYNINGIRARFETVKAWLEEQKPDIAMLQEIKSVDENFPTELFEDMGYSVATHGQKSFNGVALLSRFPLEDVVRGLPDGEGDDHARWIEATVVGDEAAVRVCCLYLPNGNPVPGPKYDYKLAWMERMRRRVANLMTLEAPLIFAGDYNVIPQMEDAARPDAWREDALFRPETRAAFRRLQNLGLTEAFRTLEPRPGFYSFWDFQRGSWQRDDGIRIDHFLLSPEAADLMTGAWIEKEARGKEKPSDHVPVWLELAA
ncbi:exodeoxyribonuclease III [Pseudoroseicyclus sp. H15]